MSASFGGGAALVERFAAGLAGLVIASARAKQSRKRDWLDRNDRSAVSR
jgi:hypothetical protein